MPGLIQPLDQFVDRSDVISQEDYPPAIFDSFAIDGVPYGVPAVEVAPGLILVYNQRLFLESGLSAEGPETLDDVIQAHRALSRYTHDGEALEQLGMDPMGAMPSVYFTEVWEAVFDVEDWYDEE